MATTHEFDIICLSETFLDSSFNSLYDRINIEGQNLLGADYLNPLNSNLQNVQTHSNNLSAKADELFECV